ncbi:MAG: hypothetical protein ACYS22_15835 [Planctomycetota bacterium]|jgi:hypothetical protein
MDLNRQILEEALQTLGAYLQARGEDLEVAAIGGSGLLLLEVVDRPTQDLDLIAIVEGAEYRCAEPLPEVLLDARRKVAQHLGLREDWLNAGPATGLFHGGLPEGFADRVQTRRFCGLTLHIASRRDQIFFKLHAAADRGEPEGKHAKDLRALAPTRPELLAAARWAQTHDPSAGFRHVLLLALKDFGVDDADQHLQPGL